MTTRTTNKWTRVYVDGYDISGDTRAIGPLLQTFDEMDLTGFSHAAKGVLPGHASLGVGTFNGVFNTTSTAGIHAVLGTTGGVMRNLMVAIGMGAEPVAGNYVYAGEFEQNGYDADMSGVYVNVPFGMASVRGSTLLYDNPFGVLLHANSAATAANSTTGAGIDTAGGATSFGGWMAYHVFSGNGTATISVDDSADDSSYSALSGATTGSIDCSTVKHGRVAIGRTATVRRYLRWQIALGSATTVTFALSFHRALR